MDNSKYYNIGGKTFANPIGKEPIIVTPVSQEQVEKNTNEIIRLDNEKANIIDVAEVVVTLSDQTFTAIPNENNVYELMINEDTTGMKDGKLTQLKMVLGNDTLRFNDSFNDSSGEGKVIVIDDRRVEIDRIVISSSAVRVEGNFRDKESLFLTYQAKFLSQA